MKKILIVDDQAVIRELLTETLSADDYHILGCENGKQAIAITKAEKPDLILMDIMMPGEVDGLEATRIIKSDPETKHCAVFLISAKSQAVDIERGFQAGGDGYFVKPFSPLELVTKVDEVLG